MTSILDRVAKIASQTQYGKFRPATTQEFFALSLATRLGEAANARHFASVTSQYSEAQLLAAYRRTMGAGADRGRKFLKELECVKAGGGSDFTGTGRLAAIRIERRAVAIAIFNGDHLRHADSRQLSSLPGNALDTAASFVTRFIDKFQFESAALEILPKAKEKQRVLLHLAVRDILNQHAISIQETDKTGLFEAFGNPGLRFRSELRKVISDIYPVLDASFGSPWTQDAAALGLYVQTERLFLSINPPPP